MKNIIGYFLIFISIILVLYVFFTSKVTNQNPTFSTYTLLSSSWEKYKTQFMNPQGRVIDYSQGGITTSEAQSYAMLRAVWIGDKTTFDNAWTWTKNDLKRPNDWLFGWRWGKKSNGTYGFQSASDMNSASDADEDIAFALILASKRWNQPSYLSQAMPILNDIWKIEVGTASGKRYLTAGNWANVKGKLIINPSYFAPYEYRVFAQVDKQHDWNSLINPGYGMLKNSSSLPLDKSKSVGLPPDWISMDQSTGQITPTGISGLTTNYAYEAVRIPWRIYLDYHWNNSQQALNYLKHNFNFLISLYKQNGKLASVYAHDGSVVSQNEGPVMYSTSLAFFLVNDPSLAKKVYQDKILSLYSNDTNSFNSNLPYYEQNWLWFGAALYDNQLQEF